MTAVIVRTLLWGGLAVAVWIAFMVFVLWMSGQAEKYGNREWNNFK